MMAGAYPRSVSAVQVGSYFVGQYYQVLQQQPDLVHQFYSDASSMIRVDGDSSETASSMLELHTLIISLNFTAIEIKTINSLDSWNGCVLVMVSGSVKTKEFTGRRKFVQTFLLAPQEKGYFILNDIFQFTEDGKVYQHPPPIQLENKYDTQFRASSPIPDPSVSDYILEEEARNYVNSVHIEDDAFDKYSIPEQEEEQFERDVQVEESPVEDSLALHQSVAQSLPEPPALTIDESFVEPEKKTYASILRISRGQSASAANVLPTSNRSVPPASDWNLSPPSVGHQSNSILSYVPESGVDAAEESFALEDEEEPKSVYVRNLPPSVTEAEIEEEFKNFGIIQPDGVFIRSRKDIGVCYAFVEFEDINGVHNALKASPIQLAGRLVYIEERRPNSSSTRGGRRGRGRSNYQVEAPRGRFGARSIGRGSSQDGYDYNRLRGNGFTQRGSRKTTMEPNRD